MEQLTLFDLSQYREKWSPLFEPGVMDKLADITALNWRNELKRRNSLDNQTLNNDTPSVAC